MIAQASPGTLIRIEEMRPPYSQPMYTAASRISAVSGGSFIAKASGIRIATPLIGPSPGSRPTTVPMNEPSVATNRLSGLKATMKPAPRWPRMSMSAPRPGSPQVAERQRDFQHDVEEHVQPHPEQRA